MTFKLNQHLWLSTIANWYSRQDNIASSGFPVHSPEERCSTIDYLTVPTHGFGLQRKTFGRGIDLNIHVYCNTVQTAAKRVEIKLSPSAQVSKEEMEGNATVKQGKFGWNWCGLSQKNKKLYIYSSFHVCRIDTFCCHFGWMYIVSTLICSWLKQKESS